MSSKPAIFPSLVYLLLRFTPIVTPLLVLDLRAGPADQYSMYIDTLLRLLIVLVVWSMTESLSMLWIREKNSGSRNARGYGAVTLMSAFLVLAFLQVFRAQSSQNQFLLLLTALGLRGMTRAGWEQGRAYISVITAILAHSLVALLSFILALHSLPWQTLVVSTAVGMLLAAVETAWNSARFQSPAASRPWIMPVLRASIVYAPLAVGSLSLLLALPKIYCATLLLLFPALRVAKLLPTEAAISTGRTVAIAGLYLAFMTIMAICRVYS